MRQQYSYQLDEEKIKHELRGRTMPASEEAYRRFCEYSDAHTRQTSGRSMSNISFRIDRKFVVPAAAAIVLIVLSIFLFNFNGSGANKETAAATSEPFVPMPQVESEIIIPQPDSHEVPAPIETKDQQALQATKSEIVREKPVAIQTDKKPDLPQEKEIPIAVAAPEEKPTQPTTTQVETKKPRRNAADILEPVQMQDIRPTIITPEQEEEIRIN